MDDARQFYDGFADQYRFLFADWQASVRRQAKIISEFLTGLGYAPPCTVLDCTCGIGTQSIALATRGYQVHGTDLSARSIERAREYSTSFTLEFPITFDTADLLQPPNDPAQYDVVLAFDNPLAHIQTQDDLRTAFQTMALQLSIGGLLTTSLRDYDTLAKERPRQSHVSVTDDDSGHRIMFQVWDWHNDGSGYQSEMFVITQQGDGWQTRSYRSIFRAWRRDELSDTLADVGLSDVQWHMPDETGFYQPIVTAIKR